MSAAIAALAAGPAAPAAPTNDASSSAASRKDDDAPAIDSTSSRSNLQSPAPAPANLPASSTAADGAAASSSPGGDSGAGEVDRVRFLQRVSGAFQAADQQGGQIRLRLSPPELGSMKLELTVRDGVMTAHVQTETEAARHMLLDNLPQLRDRLADHNIKIDHFNVESQNPSRSGTPQNFSGNGQQNQPGPAALLRRQAATAAPTATAGGSAASGWRQANGKLDVTV